MNRIVKEHYPVSALPDDLQRAVAPATHVRVTIEHTVEATQTSAPTPAPYRSRLRELGIDPGGVKGVSLAEIDKIATPRGTTPRQAVRRIRRLRDEWGD